MTVLAANECCAPILSRIIGCTHQELDFAKRHAIARAGCGVVNLIWGEQNESAPAYWISWRRPFADERSRTKVALTTILGFVVWWGFLVGHVMNDIMGFGS